MLWAFKALCKDTDGAATQVDRAHNWSRSPLVFNESKADHRRLRMRYLDRKDSDMVV
jgi:hypothetical protein